MNNPLFVGPNTAYPEFANLSKTLIICPVH